MRCQGYFLKIALGTRVSSLTVRNFSEVLDIFFLRKFSVSKRFVHYTVVSPSGTSVESYMLYYLSFIIPLSRFSYINWLIHFKEYSEAIWLNNLKTRLNKNGNLIIKYDKIIRQYINDAIVELLHSTKTSNHPESVHYLPHLTVVRKNRETVKVCIWFHD